MLSAHLNRYQGVSVSQESGFVHIVLEYPASQFESAALGALLDRLYAERQFGEMEIPRDVLQARLSAGGFPVDKKAIIDCIVDLYFARRDPAAEVRVLKCPRILFHLAEVVDLYPDARFIHLVRDGRAVFSSKRRSRSIKGSAMERNLLKAATDWRRRLRVSRRFPERLAELRYEDFLADPDGCVGKVLDHLDVSGDGRVPTKDIGAYSGTIGSSQQHLHTNVGGKLDASRVDQWKNHLSAAEVVAYEWCNGTELRRCGYAPLYESKDIGLGLRLAAMGVLVASVVHYVGSRTRNLFYLAFVRKTLWQRLVTKSYEYK